MNRRPTTRVHRRDMLQVGLLGLTGMTLADGLRLAHAADRQAATADAVLFLNLAGGPSHLDTLDMKPEAPAETRGEFQSIPSKISGLNVCEHLPKFAQAADQFTLIRGISHTTGDHPQGQAYIGTGNRPDPAVVYPSYGSVISKELPGEADLPPYIAIPATEWSAGYMGDGYAPFNTNAYPVPGKPFAVRGITPPRGVTREKLDRRQSLLARMNTRLREVDANSQLLDALDTFGQQAFHMMTSSRTREAFDVSKEPESIQKLFGIDQVGQSLLLASRLIESGVRFVTVTHAGWDTHLDNFDGHKRLMPVFDHGLTAVVTALREKGLLARTLVIAMGEFGRTPKINPNMGRDHYPRANWCVLAGGGVQPGRLVGSTDSKGEGPSDGTDIRPDDLGATLLHALGIDHHTEYYTKTNRPVGLIPHGRVMHDLFG